MEKIKEILVKFGLSHKFEVVEKINSGHINSTYRIVYSHNDSYILQRINSNVFKKPEEIMSNIDRICQCLKGRVLCPEFRKCNGKNYIISENEMWRIYKYIDNSVSYNTLDDKNMIFEFGRVAGEFHSLTKKLDVNKFYSIIDDFHNTVKIIEKTLKFGKTEYRMEFIFFRKILKYAEKLKSKRLPLSVTHNDVKCSNVLFDKKSGMGITLIDFDTVMPGLCIYDFGDGARSACVKGNKFDTESFREYCRGYFLNIKPEIAENYFLGICCITAELAARYFTDFLSGENYFSDRTSEQKLLRSRELMTLTESIISNESEIKSIIEAFE